MTTLPTTDLSTTDIRSILGISSGASTLESLCKHANVDPLGLSPTYVSGDGPTARHNTLKANPYNQGDFRGYTDLSTMHFVLAGPSDIARAHPYNELHPSKYWNLGIYHYSGAGAASPFVVHNWTNWWNDDTIPTVGGDCLIDFGAANVNVYKHYPSPGWSNRWINIIWTPWMEPSFEAYPVGDYYWAFKLDLHFTSDDFGEYPAVIWTPCVLYDYIIADPNYFDIPASPGNYDFDVWAGLFTTSAAVLGSESWITLSGTYYGLGNRNMPFTVDANLGGSRDGIIRTSGSGVPNADVVVHQNAACFVKNTPIMMANGKEKAIQDVKPGDKIMSVDSAIGEFAEDTIIKVGSTVRRHMISIVYGDRRIVCTLNQPFLSVRGRWVSYSPAESDYYYSQISKVERLNSNDKLIFYSDGWKRSDKIFILPFIEEQVTYSIQKTEKYDIYFANGLMTVSEIPGKRKVYAKIYDKRKLIVPVG